MAARKKSTARKTAKKSTARKTAKRKPAKKTTAKRKTAKKKTAKKKAAKKTVAKKTTSKKVAVGKKPFTKSEMLNTVADQTGLSRKEVSTVLDSISDIISAHLKKSGPEVFSWPGLMKIKVVKKPARPARWGTNPFTGEKMKFKAKPASRGVKILALKNLKEMAAKS